jgi:hypothetical protein
VTTADYRTALEAAAKEYEELGEQRRKIDDRLTQLAQTIGTLSRLIGFDLSNYSNELAVIHTVLKRLNEAGEIRLIPKPGGKHAYLWAKPPKVIAIGPEIAEFIRGHRE